MAVTRISDRLYSWVSEVDYNTLVQAAKTARLPIVTGHVALMPDAHVGIGATVGSVVPTESAVIPAAVGVDIGCGMVAAMTDLTQDDLPELEGFLSRLSDVVPAGVGKGHDGGTREADHWLTENPPPKALDQKQARRAYEQFGSLGSGNHFFEVCLDEVGRVWLMLHSGSRGVGNLLAQEHIRTARDLCNGMGLEDPDLAYFVQGQPEFDAYIADMLWAQRYAFANRDRMIGAALAAFFAYVGQGSEVDRINCHHNFTQREVHEGRELWITRKGAIKADVDDRGVIPGSMGTRSYIVRGKGSTDSWKSCSHGAGRRLSRSAAKKAFTADDLVAQMGDRVWQQDQASALVDEIPSAYKDIDQVMADQDDLVFVEHTLRAELNYKGA